MSRKDVLYTPYNGAVLLENPLLNKGLAFIKEERDNFNLHGLLPHNVETIEEQTERAWVQFCHFKSDISRHVYLRNIQDTNETLFYNLLRSHLKETLPIIYTPTVGEACEHFSTIYRRARGLFISWPNRHRIDEMLQSFSRNDIRVIVVTDGERILGLGDQGIGGMGIPIGKLSLYTACGGIHPASTLPIMLDVGTNNQQHLDDPMYMGWRHPRISDDQYAEFMDMFISTVKARWPNVLLQFEDFAQKNATRLLQRYRDQLCCFNDDIQGTAAVTAGTLIAAAHAAGTRIRDQRVVFLGSGSAGCGIAEKIVALMVDDGLSESEARSRIFMVDRFGLLTDDIETVRAGDRLELEQVTARLHEYGCIDGAEPSEREMVEGLYRYVAKVPSKLVVASLVDAVGDVRPQNMPGTGADQYPNWCVPLCDSDGEEVFIEELPSNERLTSLFALLTGSVC